MKILKIFIFLIFIKNSSQNSINKNPKLIVDFLNYSKVKTGIMFYCNESLDFNQWKLIQSSEFKYFSFHEISKFNFKEEENINFLMKFNYNKMGVICDLSCPKIDNLFNISSKFNFFNSSYSWLMVTENLNSSIELLSPQNINLDAEITLAVENEYYYELYDIYNPSFKYGAELIVTPKGNYYDEFNFTMTESKFDQRSDLKGIKINVGVAATHVKKSQTLLEFLESEDNPSLDVQHRHHYRLFKVLAKKHNFTFLMHRTSIWISSSNNGTFATGLLKMYKTKQIDMSISPLRVAPDRIDLMHFSVTTYVTTPTIIFRHPRNSFRSPFLQPLSPWVWNCILIITIIVSILITITMRRSVRRKVSLIRAFMTAHGVMCQQGFMENFNRSSTRFILLIFIFFSQIINQFYGSYIVGSLLTDPPKTINNIRQLIDSNIKVGIEDVIYNKVFFQSTTDPLAIELYNKKVLHAPSGGFLSIDQGLALMQKGGFAFHFDTSYGYRMISELFNEDEICELHQMILHPYRPLSVTVTKNSPFKELIMVEMLRLTEHGIINYFDNKWQGKKPHCVKSITKVKAMDIDDASWIFLILIFAILMSILVALCENFHYWIFQKRKINVLRK